MTASRLASPCVDQYREVLFLSVPYTRPPSKPDGSPSAAADRARHQLINQMLRDAARGRPNVRVLNIDKVVSPSGAYGAGGDPQADRPLARAGVSWSGTARSARAAASGRGAAGS